MANVKATDLIDFTRASKGHALAKVSYGDNELPSASFTVVSNGTWDGTQFVDTVGSQVRPGVTSGTALTNGTTYALFINITNITGATQVRVDGLDGTDRLLGEGDHRVSFISNGGTPRVRLEDTSTSVNDGFALQTALTAKEVLFNQPDGTLQLFEHPNNIPRIEYDADGNLLGLLIEEARTNLVTQSEDFNTVVWGKLDSATGTPPVVTSDYADGPYPQTRADRLQASRTGSGYSLIQMGSFGANTGDYTNSIWIKSNTGSNQEVYFRVKAGVNKTVIATSEWQRVSITDTLSSEATYFTIGTWSNNPSSELNVDVLIWGAQTEAGSFPTSYIKTQGSAVSRAADVASIDVDQFGYNQSEGTLFVELQHFDPRTGSKIATGAGFGDGTTNNRMWYYQNKGQWIGVSGGVSQFSMTGSEPSENTPTKFAGAFKTNDFTAYIDGTSIGADSSGSVPTVPTLFIGYSGTSNSELNGYIKSLTYTPKRLSNAKLQELTS